MTLVPATFQAHAPRTVEPGESTEPANGPSPDITIEPDSTPGLPQVVKATVGYTPDWKMQGQVVATEFASLRGNNSVRKQFISLAGILGDYNKGITGPGHCDEDGFWDQGFTVWRQDEDGASVV